MLFELLLPIRLVDFLKYVLEPVLFHHNLDQLLELGNHHEDIKTNLPSYFLRIVFLVLKYSGHFLASAIAIDDSAKARIDWNVTKHSMVVKI